MNRKQKEHVVEALERDFQTSQASFLVGYKGLSVEQLSQLRNQLRDRGASLKVTKTTLMRRVSHNMATLDELAPFFKDQVALVFAREESPAIAKILYDFSKNNQKLSVVAGHMDSAFLSKDSIKTLATLPSREVLLAQVIGTLQAPIAGLVRTLNTLVVSLPRVIKQIEEKKSSNP